MWQLEQISCGNRESMIGSLGPWSADHCGGTPSNTEGITKHFSRKSMGVIPYVRTGLFKLPLNDLPIKPSRKWPEARGL